ncbi:MAG TPA: NADH-quinone oxidoreductase subunit F [Planctomycetes bacterium]|nr:NADH-quinone oxidoreductase subunit F [Planctomycetota bacterium]
MKIRSVADLDRIKKEGLGLLYPNRTKIVVGTATCGLAAGAGEVLEAFRRAAGEGGLDAVVEESGCIGFCQMEPLVAVYRPGKPKLVYHTMTPKKAEALCRELREGTLSGAGALGEIRCEKALLTGEERRFAANGGGETALPDFDALPFYRKQLKIALRNCGYIDPEDIRHYIARGGYYTLYTVLTERAPEEIIDEVTKSGLRGRGGGGFPTGRKWRSCRNAPGARRYVICNADEGDPGAFMDRSLLEGDPHGMLEGMIIGAFAMGSDQGYIYVRNEYPQAIKKLMRALEECRACGLLGADIMGSGFSFDIAINRGGGAFVCGESTALMASIEGKVGEPRAKYIHTVEQGLHNLPTCLNNVETWANVPVVMRKGAAWFASIGTEGSKGTKVFSLVGDVKHSGLIEVPMGISIREVLYDIGGGIEEGHRFKAVQTGGPSGGTILVDEKGATVRTSTPSEDGAPLGFVPEGLLDLPVDFDSLTEAGSMMGSGGMIVMDEKNCMVDIARYYISFLCEESCGRCLPCREGLRQMAAILDRITSGRGEHGDIELLEELGAVIMDTSLCALGGTAANPPLSTIRYFRDEYEAHIYDKKCPAGVCKALIRFVIDPAACTGCGACRAACPVGAVKEGAAVPAPAEGDPAAPKKARLLHEIEQAACIKCGACADACKFNAVRKE